MRPQEIPWVDENTITMIEDILEHPTVAPKIKVGERPHG